MTRAQAWIAGAMALLGVVVVAFVVAMLRAARQIPPPPVEADPAYERLIEQEQAELERIEAVLEQDHAELAAVVDTADADERSAAIAALLNTGAP